MDAVGRRPGGRLGPELVPKPVAGGAFTVACKADPERATRSREDPSRAAWGSVGVRYDPRRDGVAGQADAVGIRPGRKATASLHGRAGRLVVETHP